MYRAPSREGFAICIPYIGKDGNDHLAPIHEVGGWESTQANAKELLVAEFVVSDGLTPMSFNEFMKVASMPNDECNVYIKSVVVAKQACEIDVQELLDADPTAFAGLCVEKVLEASIVGMFNEDVLLSEWKKLGYEKKDLGESLVIATEQ